MNTQKPVTVTGVLSQVVRSFEPSVLRGWYGSIREMMGGSKAFYALLISFWMVVYASTLVALDAISIGYHEAYAVTRDIPWGILIAAYIFFVVTSTGLCIVSAIGHIFGQKNFMPLGKRAVFLSIVTIMCGFVCILLEIENPFKMMLYNMVSPNFTSNIWWMGTLYGAYMFFMILEFAFLQLGVHRLAMYSGLVALISGIAAHSNLGAIFGMLHGREFWYGPYMPIYFIVSAMMSGCAAIMLFTVVAYKVNGKDLNADEAMKNSMKAVGKLCVLLISILMFFTVWKILTGLVGAAGKVETIHSFLTGPYALNFWVFEVGLGMAIPFVLLFISKFENFKLMAWASAMMIVGIFMMRYDLVVLGQVVSVFHELGVNEYQGLLEYTPSFHEIGIIIGALGLTAMTFLIGEKVFKGHVADEHH
jgi:molybdopterin-containing oxidoreductase family membrane subunit